MSTKTPADWLEAGFDLRASILGPDPESNGSLLSFKSIMDAGAAMRIREIDYDDPDGLWL